MATYVVSIKATINYYNTVEADHQVEAEERAYDEFCEHHRDASITDSHIYLDEDDNA